MKLLFIAVAAATINPPLTGDFSMVCDGTLASGFNWRAGRWVQTDFKTNRLVVVKGGENSCFDLRGGATEIEAIGDSFAHREVCVSVREFEKPYKPTMSNKCTEFYTSRTSGKWEITLNCDGVFTGDFSAVVDGNFRRFSDSTIGEAPENDYRDSMVIEVGRCARVN